MRRTEDGARQKLATPADEYFTGKRLRACEWAYIVFFLYIACIAPAFRLGPPEIPFLFAGEVICVLVALAYAEEYLSRWVFSYARDWVSMGLVLVAYREMDWFTPKIHTHVLENGWIAWDRILLQEFGMRRGIEAAGVLLPGLLELSYLLVYAVGPFTVVMLYIYRRRDRVGWILFVYVVGTMAAYGLFPYFPSSPPRVVFKGLDMPGVTTALRELNLSLVGDYGIHSSVFPSAHVSSAFSAAWAALVFLPDKKRLGWGLVVYSILVSIATVYGRYHYAVDAIGGVAVSAGAILATRLAMKRGLLTERNI